MGNFFDINKAIVRLPSKEVGNGLRSVDYGDPSYELVKTEHDAYVKALVSEGVDVEILAPLPGFPDALFVEDPALVFSEAAVVLKSSRIERSGEGEILSRSLENNFHDVFYLDDGFVDGGDILQLPDTVIIGLSQRTDRKGAEALRIILNHLGKKSMICKVPSEVLHLKSDCSLIDCDTILVTEKLADEKTLSGFNKIIVPEKESNAANTIRIKSKIFIGEQFPATIQVLEKSGFELIPLGISEISKIDAGLSCMSLRWSQ